MTHGDKIDRLAELVAKLTVRVDALDQLVPDVRTLLVRVALVEHQVATLHKATEESSRRLWTILTAVIGAVIGSIVTSLIS